MSARHSNQSRRPSVHGTWHLWHLSATPSTAASVSMSQKNVQATSSLGPPWGRVRRLPGTVCAVATAVGNVRGSGTKGPDRQPAGDRRRRQPALQQPTAPRVQPKTRVVNVSHVPRAPQSFRNSSSARESLRQKIGRVEMAVVSCHVTWSCMR